jgi:hypothetical protein
MPDDAVTVAFESSNFYYPEGVAIDIRHGALVVLDADQRVLVAFSRWSAAWAPGTRSKVVPHLDPDTDD